MRGRTIAVTMVAGLLAACGASEPQELVDAKTEAASLLKDPGSAQFRDLRQMKAGVVCGMMNGKNEFGAYTGFKGFVNVPYGARAPRDHGPGTAHMGTDDPAALSGGDGTGPDYWTLYGCL